MTIDKLPDIKIKGVNGSHVLVATFSNVSQVIKADPGSMIYKRGHVDKPETEKGTSWTNMFKRAFAGQSMFMSTFRGLPESSKMNGILALSSDIPADIIEISIPVGKELRISRGSFLACSENVTMEAALIKKGFIPWGQDEGGILPVLKVQEGSGPGKVWLSSFGMFEKHDLVAKEEMTIDNGVFLAVDNDVKYEIVKIGKTILGSLLTGEGFGMKFVGPCTIYTQSKNFDDFSHVITNNKSVSVSRGPTDNNIHVSMGGKRILKKTTKPRSVVKKAKTNKPPDK